MKNEIERKWLIKTIPGNLIYKKENQERFFLFIDEKIELRIQKINDKYTLERKVALSKIERRSEEIQISKGEYDLLKTLSDKSITRDNYILNTNPEITLKIYHGDFEGLVRAEVEFENELDANKFIIPNWFGKEITNSLIARDKDLIKINKLQFQRILNEFI